MLFCFRVSARQDLGDRIGALQAARGDKTDGLSHKRGAGIADSSPKANALARKRAGADVPIRVRKGIVTIPAQNARVGGVVQAAAALLSPFYCFQGSRNVGFGFWAKNGDYFSRPAVTDDQVRALVRARKAPFLSPKS